MKKKLKQLAEFGDFTLRYHGIADIWTIHFIDYMEDVDNFIYNKKLDKCIELAITWADKNICFTPDDRVSE